MTEENTNKKALVIWIPVIVALVALLGTMIDTTWFSEKMIQPTPTMALTETGTPSGVSVGANTETPLVELSMPIPPPLLEIFPQTKGGKEFVRTNSPITFANDFLTDDCVHEGIYGLKISYDLEENTGDAVWGVDWKNTSTGYIDLTQYTTLQFWAKARTGRERFDIVIKDLSYKYGVGISYSSRLSKDWQLVRIPLKEFSNINLAFVQNIHFDFNRNHTSGVVCIDDISFVK